MTKREFLEKVIAEVEVEEAVAFAREELEKLDTQNERRRAKVLEKRKADEPLKEKIVEVLSAAEGMTATEIGEALEISTQKASALLKKMFEEGTLGREKEKKAFVYHKA